MELEELTNFIECAPDCAGVEVETKALAWLSDADYKLEAGAGEGVVLVVFATHTDLDFEVFAVPGTSFDEAAHRDLAKVHREAFAYHFGADLEPHQWAGALRLCGGLAEEVDEFADQVEEEGEGVEGLDFDALIQSAGSWRKYRVDRDGKLAGPVTHLYAATLAH